MTLIAKRAIGNHALKTATNYRVSIVARGHHTNSHTHTHTKGSISGQKFLRNVYVFIASIFPFAFLILILRIRCTTNSNHVTGLMIYTLHCVFVLNSYFINVYVLTPTNWLRGLRSYHTFFCLFLILVFLLIRRRKTCFIRTGVQNPGLSKLLARLVWPLILKNKRVTGKAK